MENKLPFSNTKVYVGTKSEEVQKKLGKMGYKWFDGEKIPSHTDAPFLYIGVIFGYKYTIVHGSTFDLFKKYKCKEVTADEIINYDPISCGDFSGTIVLPMNSFTITYSCGHEDDKPKKKLPLPKFEPFDKVLFRDHENEAWRCGFFSHQRGASYAYCCGGFHWKMCIPYNEETKALLGCELDSPYEDK